MRAARIAIPDLISRFLESQRSRSISFNREGLDVMHELIFANDKARRRAICALPARALPARDVA